MSKKRSADGPYSYDDDEDYVPSKAVKYSSQDNRPDLANKPAHSLDSDDEDVDEPSDCAGAEKAYDVLKEDDIEGQEEKTVEYDGENTITPFNMKDEMEEGHFDGDGFYHFKKDNEQIKDAWLDDIDWIKVKHAEENKNKYGSDNEDSDDEMNITSPTAAEQERVKELAVYSQILKFLQPGETVTKAVKRLGGTKKLTSAQKWKLKKQQQSAGTRDAEPSPEQDNLQRMLQLTELANQIMETGNMDVYQETYEMITVKLRLPKEAPPAMDMFSDAGPTDTTTSKDSALDEKSTVDEVRWQMRWENKDGSEVLGPFPSSQLLKWQESGYFNKGAYVRKVSDRDTAWYHTNRMDFELYV